MSDNSKTDESHEALKDASQKHEEQPGEVLPENEKDDAKESKTD